MDFRKCQTWSPGNPVSMTRLAKTPFPARAWLVGRGRPCQDPLEEEQIKFSMLLTLRNVFHHSQSISRAYVAFAVAVVSHSVLSLVSQEPRYAERNKRPSRKHLEELSVVLPDCEPLSTVEAFPRSCQSRAADTQPAGATEKGLHLRSSQHTTALPFAKEVLVVSTT